VLAQLLLRANQVVSVDWLVDGLWAGQPPAQARSSLHNAVRDLRNMLTRHCLETTSCGYRLHLEPDQLDAALFENMQRRASDEPPATRIKTLDQALQLWAGDHPYVDVLYDDFAQAEIRRLDERRLLALEARIAATLELGEPADALPELFSLVTRHPYRERFRLQLMTALERAGRSVEALETYEHYRLLLQEWNTRPSSTIARAAEAIRDRDPPRHTPQ
jgi:DNA-binding SARP family transcriptional activator